MMLSSVPTRMRVVPLSHSEWKPHAYQQRAVDHLTRQNAAALFLDPGLGKTSIVLQAYQTLKQSGQAQRMLVVAPRRVCQLVWRQEAKKWTQFRDLTFTFLHGPKKNKLLVDSLRNGVDVFLINPEGVAWLAAKYFGRSLPFDIVVFDELTKFKNSQAVRHKKLRPRLAGVRRRWGLTGSMAPNGYLDLFGQFLILDDGAALGRYLTHYRDTYFQPDFSGFDYVLQPRGAERIQERIAPYVLCMQAEDYISLPPLVDDIRLIDMSKESRAVYDTMRKKMLVELPEGAVTAANSAAVYNKLKQLANGAVYVADDKQVAAVIHDDKLEALEELVDELNGDPLLVAYEFNHDLARLRERFSSDGVAFMADASETEAVEIMRKWNGGELRLLFAHPASAGHGLNLQGGGASHVCWFGPIWDFELYDQFIRRIRRQGNVASCVVNHILVVNHTIDELALQALREKDTTQSRLRDALKASLIEDGTAAPYAADDEKDSKMVVKLSRQSTTTAAPAQEAGSKATPKGWPTRAATAQALNTPAEEAHDEAQQRATVASKLLGGRATHVVENDAPAASNAGKAGFSAAIQKELAGGEPSLPFDDSKEVAPAPKVIRTRKTKDEVQEPAAPAGVDVSAIADAINAVAKAVETTGGEAAGARHNELMRAKALQLAFSSAFEFSSLDEGFAVAKELLGFIKDASNG